MTVPLSEAIGNAVKNFTCSALQFNAEAQRYFARATSGIPGLGAYNEIAARGAEGFRNLICPRDPWPGVTYPPTPSDAKNCPVLLKATVIWNGELAFDTAPAVWEQGNVNNFAGPIQNVRVASQNVTGATIYRLFVTYGDGVERFLTQKDYLRNRPVDYSISWARVDGLADPCVEQTPQEPPTGTGNITYFDFDGTVIVNAPIVLAPSFPIINIDGSVHIPFTVEVGGIDFNVDFNLSDGSVGIGGAGQGGASNCCPPILPAPQVDNPNDPPPPTDDSRILGIKTNITAIATAAKPTQVGDGTGPDIYLPRLGVVRFAVEVGGSRAWTADQPIKTLSQFTPVNAPAFAYDFTVLAEPGVTIEPLPIYIEVG